MIWPQAWEYAAATSCGLRGLRRASDSASLLRPNTYGILGWTWPRAWTPSARFTVKVVPGSSRDQIVGWLGDALKIKVMALPENGHANEAVVAILADRLGVRRDDVQMSPVIRRRPRRSRSPGSMTTPSRRHCRNVARQAVATAGSSLTTTAWSSWNSVGCSSGRSP